MNKDQITRLNKMPSLDEMHSRANSERYKAVKKINTENKVRNTLINQVFSKKLRSI
jgi:hypothetical protein